MNLIEHAEKELAKAGLGADDPDFKGKIAESVMELVRCFDAQGHSGYSMEMVREVLHELLKLKPLTPLTDDPEEWEDVSEPSGYPLWQNRRDPTVFSNDAGKTTFEVGDKPIKNPHRQVDVLTDGLIWCLNRSVLHPRGFAIGTDEERRLFMYGSGEGVWRYEDLEDEKREAFDAMLERIAAIKD